VRSKKDVRYPVRVNFKPCQADKCFNLFPVVIDDVQEPAVELHLKLNKRKNIKFYDFCDFTVETFRFILASNNHKRSHHENELRGRKLLIEK